MSQEGRKQAMKKLAIGAAAVAALILLLLYLQGSIGGHKVPPGTSDSSGAAPAAERTVAAQIREIEDYLEWPGTIRSRKSAALAPKLMGRILEIKVNAGDAVKAGRELAVLDDRDIRSKAAQAKSGVEGARAQAERAEADYNRVKGLFDKEAATKRDLESAEAAAKAARAQVSQAEDALKEANILLTETRITAPFDGVVAEKLAEPGDMGVPGKPIFVLHDPVSLRLEAQVPETCARKAKIGMDVVVRFDALSKDALGKIDEIAPTADPQSRTFLLKASLPEDKELRAGMFGRFIQPCGRKKVLLIPRAAVQKSGQLEMVRVLAEGGARTRHVKTGKVHEEEIEIVSGLKEGDKVIVKQP